MNTKAQAGKLKLQTYLVGFASSIVLTLAAYFLTQHHVNSGHVSPSDNWMVVLLLILAIVQLLVQLMFFLHLGRETRPRWRAMALLFALGVVLIVVVGSLWIMNNLDYRMTPQQQSNYLKDQDGGI